MSKSAEALAQLLEERLRPGADVKDVDRRIVSLFGETWCVVFVDMVGFVRRSAEQGIIPFLALLHELDTIGSSILQRNAGFVLKKIADSSMVIFRDPRAALRACVELQRTLAQRNEGRPDAEKLLVGCGIGFGSCLKLGDDEIFGVEVNHADKLAEDIAGPYEVCLTPEARKALGEFAGVRFCEVPGQTIDGKLAYHAAVFEIMGHSNVAAPAAPAKPASRRAPKKRSSSSRRSRVGTDG
jgi:class 3 adenylate cyclase